MKQSRDRIESIRSTVCPIDMVFQFLISPGSGSPPVNPRTDSESSSLFSHSLRWFDSVNHNDASMRNLQLKNVKSLRLTKVIFFLLLSVLLFFSIL
ncbi:hypothetical protein Bca4012_060549 [Brassica carinata]|uniref:Uncharacterized protein n=1 Tax=Brassica carinata TaxID=52824 RepID=A0A8X7WME6_BRACI|nr:hypothetical protein Bca52824_002620 [Brassica carinata]